MFLSRFPDAITIPIGRQIGLSPDICALPSIIRCHPRHIFTTTLSRFPAGRPIRTTSIFFESSLCVRRCFGRYFFVRIRSVVGLWWPQVGTPSIFGILTRSECFVRRRVERVPHLFADLDALPSGTPFFLGVFLFFFFLSSVVSISSYVFFFFYLPNSYRAPLIPNRV